MWRLPAGQVENKETLDAALARILKESAGAVIEGRAQLFAIYPNHKQFPGDHLALYAVRTWAQMSRSSPQGLEHGFFPADQLPPDLDAQMAARIRAVIDARVK